MLLAAGLFSTLPANSQRLKKAEKIVVAQLKEHVHFLADDRLEGRRAGTKGEQLAAEYIKSQFEGIGLTPKGSQGNWYQEFPIYDGKDYSQASYLFINGNELNRKNFFPHPLSPERMLEAMPSIALKEAGVPWFLDFGAELEANKSNPHFDREAALLEKVKYAAGNGATALIVYKDPEMKYNPKEKGDELPIPVLFLNKTEADKYLHDETDMLEIKLKTGFTKLERTGRNVVGYMDNGAAHTVVLGAHYDHLGYGEDGNSMVRTENPGLHNGADDNASGTAALIELARMLKNEKKNSFNYLFIAFSAEELGLFGSKFFTENSTIPLTSVNYMVNMDMVGRLNDSSKTLTVGGYGTSPTWGNLFTSISDNRYLKLKFDSSGTGASDHSSFYRKDIPVLFFFTGLHTDYHKPSDDAERINYTGELRIIQLIQSVIQKTGDQPRLSFTKTREQQMGSSTRFTVSLGILPDYAYSGKGVRVEGVTDGRPAQKAGIKAGDIITKLGDLSIASMDQYMKALGKFKKGDKTTVSYTRDSAEYAASIEF
jgi:hypothetical protein